MLKKLSLAALVAMGSMSVASATDLSQAIKGVNLTGMVRVRFYNEATKDANSYNRWRTDADFKFTVPASESVNVVYQLATSGNVYSDDDQLTGGTTNPSPAAIENQVYLTYAANGATAMLGKIPVATSVTGKGHGEAKGAGAIATYKLPAAPVTLAGAWINALVNADQVGTLGNDIYAVAALFNTDMVKGSVWYYKATNLVDHLYTVSADATPVKMVDLHVDYANGKLQSDNNSHTYYNVSAKGSMAGATVKLGYAHSDDKGTLVTLDNDAPIAAVGTTANNYSIANKLDTTMLYAKVGYNVDTKTNVYLAYATTDDKTTANKDISEYTVGAKYKYTKKLGFGVHYDVASKTNAADNNEFRFEAKYKF
jgi:hypothetical protein